MKILPVLDLLDGVVVRGVAGQRDAYRPVESCLSATADAVDVARGFRDRLGLSELYVADLDAILHERPNSGIYRALADEGCRSMVDAGLRDVRRAADVLDDGAESVVAGLETLPGPQLLAALCREIGCERVVFSLDLKAGRPLCDPAAWDSDDPLEIARSAVQAGAERMIVLDLAGVGMGGGVSTSELCGRLRQQFPRLQIITGGGVSRAADFERLDGDHIDAVLVASALHDGRLGRAEIETIGGPGR